MDISATRCVAAGEIVVWDVLKHITSLVNPKLEVILDPRLRLQFPKTNTKYMRMSCSQGTVPCKHSLYQYLEKACLDKPLPNL